MKKVRSPPRLNNLIQPSALARFGLITDRPCTDQRLYLNSITFLGAPQERGCNYENPKKPRNRWPSR